MIARATERIFVNPGSELALGRVLAWVVVMVVVVEWGGVE